MDSKTSRSSAVYDYFDYDASTSKYKCTLQNCKNSERPCGSEISRPNNSNPCGNLKRHLERYHPENCKKVKEQDLEKKQNSSKEGSKLKAKSRQMSILSHVVSHRQRVTMSRETFIRGIVQMVQDGVPLSHFEGRGFKTLNGEMAANLGVALGRDAIRSYIKADAERIREKIKDAVKDQLIYIKMDGGRTNGKDFVAVNVQLFCPKQNRQAVYTLACCHFDERKTGQNLTALVMEIITKFEIKCSSVLALVVDSASNMTKTAELLNMQAQQEGEFGLTDILSTQTEIASHMNVYHQRCTVHLLQRCIKKSLDINCKTLFQFVRSLVKTLKTSIIISYLDKHGYRHPINDVETRWGSAHEMNKRLIELRPAVEQLALTNETFKVEDESWDKLQELHDVLEAPYQTTILLQASNLTPGRFIKEWFGLKNKLSFTSSQISATIVEEMNKKEELLFKDDLLLAAVFLDSRYRILLSNRGYQARAISTIQGVAVRYSNLNESVEVIDIQCDHPTVPAAAGQEDPFLSYLSSLEENQQKRRSIEKIDKNMDMEKKITQQVEEMLKRGRIKDQQKDIWAQAEEMEEPLKTTTRMICSMPVTQVSVERLFSTMNFIYSTKRFNMKPELLENILISKLNDC